MSVSVNVGSIQEQVDRQRAEAEAAYRDLVRRVASGVPFNLEGHRSIIFSAGRSFEDFQVDMRTLAGRLEAIEQFKQADAEEEAIEPLREERAKLIREAVETRRELMAKIEEAEKRAGEANARERFRDDDIRRLRIRAGQTLQETYDPNLDGEADTLKRAIDQSRSTLHWVERDIEDLQRHITNLEEWATRNGKTLADEPRGPQARLTVLQDRRKRLEEEIIECQERLAKMEEQKLDPHCMRWTTPGDADGSDMSMSTIRQGHPARLSSFD